MFVKTDKLYPFAYNNGHYRIYYLCKMRLRLYCFCLFIFMLCSRNVNAQILVNTFIDPCSKKVTVFVVPIQGAMITFMNKSKFFTPSDVSSGALMVWVNQVYAEYSAPCPVSQVANQITQNTVSNAVSSVVASSAGSISVTPQAPTSSSPSVQTASSSGGQSSSSSSSSEGNSGGSSGESKSETKSEGGEKSEKGESKGESKKESSKGDKKDEKKKSTAKQAQTPLIFSSDFSNVYQLDGKYSLMANLGVSRASLAGDVSYGGTAVINANMRQFALSGRYSKMEFSGRELCGIASHSYSVVYNDGNTLHMYGFSYIMMYKSNIYGYALSIINTTIPYVGSKQQFFTSSVVLFGMKPIMINRRHTIVPELFIMGSPVSYSAKSDDLMVSNALTYIVGSSYDLNLSKRFKISTNVKYMFPVHTIGLQIGTKFNL